MLFVLYLLCAAAGRDSDYYPNLQYPIVGEPDLS